MIDCIRCIDIDIKIKQKYPFTVDRQMLSSIKEEENSLFPVLSFLPLPSKLLHPPPHIISLNKKISQISDHHKIPKQNHCSLSRALLAKRFCNFNLNINNQYQYQYTRRRGTQNKCCLQCHDPAMLCLDNKKRDERCSARLGSLRTGTPGVEMPGRREEVNGGAS